MLLRYGLEPAEDGITALIVRWHALSILTKSAMPTKFCRCGLAVDEPRTYDLCTTCRWAIDRLEQKEKKPTFRQIAQSILRNDPKWLD